EPGDTLGGPVVGRDVCEAGARAAGVFVSSAIVSRGATVAGLLHCGLLGVVFGPSGLRRRLLQQLASTGAISLFARPPRSDRDPRTRVHAGCVLSTGIWDCVVESDVD